MRTRLPLGDFDVLAQLAIAGGELRMTDLATKAFSSRSAMTRRVDRIVEEGLVRRATRTQMAAGWVVALTDAGLARLEEAFPSISRGCRSCSSSSSTTRSSRRSSGARQGEVDCSFG